MTAAQEPASETPETKPKKSLGFFSADALKKLFGFGGYRPNLRTAPNALGPERGTAEEALGATLFERFGPSSKPRARANTRAWALCSAFVRRRV